MESYKCLMIISKKPEGLSTRFIKTAPFSLALCQWAEKQTEWVVIPSVKITGHFNKTG